jgi:hypothetical protein
MPIPPADQPGKRALVDGFLRIVTYLRASVGQGPLRPSLRLMHVA